MEWDENHWNQIGIVSYTPMGCASPDYPTVFTRLAPYYNWIQSILRRSNHTVSNVAPSNSSGSESRSLVKKKGQVFPCHRDSIDQCGCGFDDVEFSWTDLVGSHEARPYSWSMIVSVRLNDSNTHACSGTILNQHYILTAAHCVDKQVTVFPLKSSIAARAHDQLVDDKQIIRRVDRIILHPAWQSIKNDHQHDLAILHLSEPLDLVHDPYMYPTCLPPSLASDRHTINTALDDSRLLVVGWDLKKAMSLQQREVFAVNYNHSSCNRSVANVQFQFCAIHHRETEGRRSSHRNTLSIIESTLYFSLSFRS